MNALSLFSILVHQTIIFESLVQSCSEDTTSQTVVINSSLYPELHSCAFVQRQEGANPTT